ncbi:MAG: outer membrane lipoprotein carrier protein LolA, partial [Myxococcales bacterium]|nr:outer membrane lipoprotein carrier protein LolA [Myxococcales bacterium]
MRAETPAPAPITLEAVMQRLASSPGFRADFREVREIALLREPLESTGTLYFVPPDRLARHTHSPEPGLMLIEGDRLRTRDALGEEELDLAAQPRARRLVDQLTLLLRGDLPALRDAYETDFDAAGSDWSLVLVPRDVVAREIIGRISLHG